MNKRHADILRLQKARVAADALKGAAGGNSYSVGGTYLTSSFARSDDLPPIASVRKMSSSVARRLAELGLFEPISLQRLPNSWWKVNVDAAEIGKVAEYGCAFVTLVLSSSELEQLGFEVVDGPFSAWENTEVSQAILRKSPNKYWDASVSNRPLLPVLETSEPFAGYDDVYTSDALIAALDAGKTLTVFSGPFDTADEAHYALDVRWENPE